MKWLWLFAAFVVAALVVTCNIKQAEDWLAKQSPPQDQIQTTMDLLQNFPTAAGKGGKK